MSGWFYQPAHEHYGPCDGFADGDCSECRRMAWLARNADKRIEHLRSLLRTVMERGIDAEVAKAITEELSCNKRQ